MYGCYKINFLNKKNNESKKSIFQKNSITADGMKKILDMLSYNLNGSYGYKFAKKIAKGSFKLNGKTFNYKSSFFNWGKINHPFNFNFDNSSYTEFPETEIAKQVLTENYNLNEIQADKILNPDNKQRIDWGLVDSKTSGSNNGYELSSYKTWFNVGIGMVEQEEILTLPVYDKNGNVLNSDDENVVLLNSDNEINLLGSPIYKDTVKVISTIIPDAKPYKENSDYSINYDTGKIKIENSELFNNLSETETGVLGNKIKVSYVWNGARYIDELKNGICGVYVNAQPSIKNDSSSYGNENYFGMGTFSCDNGNTWEGYSFPWKGLPLKNLNHSTDARAGMNMTGFNSINTEFDHYFPTFPYTFINPTNFAFAFCTNGKNSFQIRNLNFLVPDFPPFTLNEIELISGENKIKKQVEWCGVGEEKGIGEEESKIFSEWKIYLDADEGNEMVFDSISTYFSNDMKNLKDGWNEMQYPEFGNVQFSNALFSEPWEKNSDEVIEVSYRIYFNEVEEEKNE